MLAPLCHGKDWREGRAKDGVVTASVRVSSWSPGIFHDPQRVHLPHSSQLVFLRCKPDRPPCSEIPDGCWCSQDKIQMPHVVTRLWEICLIHSLPSSSTSSSTSLPAAQPPVCQEHTWPMAAFLNLHVISSTVTKLDPFSQFPVYFPQCTPHSWHHVNILSFPCSLS